MVPLLFLAATWQKIHVTSSLGSLREQFDTPGESQRYRGGLTAYPTEIYFPEGKADERFLVNVDIRQERKGGPLLKYFALTYQVKKNGKVFDQWTIPLKGTVGPPTLIGGSQGLGSFEKMLLRRGLVCDGEVPGAAKNRLDKAEGYSGYWKGSAVSGTLWYWYTDAAGAPGKPHPLDLDRLLDRKFGFPHLPVPYPIGDEELRAISVVGK